MEKSYACSITQINIDTGKAAKLPPSCPDLKVPFGIVVLDKSTLLVSDAKMQQIDRIDLASKTCKKITSISTTGREQAWLMKRYDAEHVIIDVFSEYQDR